MKKGHYKCTYCHEIFNEEEESKNFEPGSRLAMCWDCYKRNYMIDCQLCEGYFRNNSKPGKFYFVLMPADVKVTGMKSGIYRANRFPVWSSDMFTATINQENVELITSLDKTILTGDGHTNEICKECFNKYTNKNWLILKRKNLLLEAIKEKMSRQIGKLVVKHKGNLKYFNKMFQPIFKTINDRQDILCRKMRKMLN